MGDSPLFKSKFSYQRLVGVNLLVVDFTLGLTVWGGAVPYGPKQKTLKTSRAVIIKKMFFKNVMILIL